jgi:AAA+ ATPase superfamily predicted ATPase
MMRANKHYDQNQVVAKNWMEAFQQLASLMDRDTAKTKLIFIDELPWMDKRQSGLITALDYFWNAWASSRTDVKLVVCGSSASWMIKNLLNNKKGLYNRVTNRIKLQPFTLSETQEFLIAIKAKYNKPQIIELFMALGGIPYHLTFVKPKLSVTQNINALFFEDNAKFRDEYELIFASLFNNYQRHIAVVNALATKKKGLFKAEIVKATKIADGGSLTTILNELEASDFIRKYRMPGKTVRSIMYQLNDNFILFYTNFLLKKAVSDNKFWINTLGKPSYNAWAGLAFEMVCLQHTDQIKNALGIGGIQTNMYAWSNGKSQIDLILDRSDNVINLIEIKYADNEYTISKSYEKNLMNKVSEFKEYYKTKKAIWMVLLSTYGLASMANAGLIHTSITADVLFEK